MGNTSCNTKDETHKCYTTENKKMGNATVNQKIGNTAVNKKMGKTTVKMPKTKQNIFMLQEPSNNAFNISLQAGNMCRLNSEDFSKS